MLPHPQWATLVFQSHSLWGHRCCARCRAPFGKPESCHFSMGFCRYVFPLHYHFHLVSSTCVFHFLSSPLLQYGVQSQDQKLPKLVSLFVFHIFCNLKKSHLFPPKTPLSQTLRSQDQCTQLQHPNIQLAPGYLACFPRFLGILRIIHLASTYNPYNPRIYPIQTRITVFGNLGFPDKPRVSMQTLRFLRFWKLKVVINHN